jgi:hypothetical protein
MKQIDCRKCFFCKPRLVADYYNKIIRQWKLAHIVYYCKRYKKGVRLVKRECSRFAPKRQTLLVKQEVKKVKERGNNIGFAGSRQRPD